MKKRILIVEDERIIAEDLRITLEGFGYEVLDIISNGPEAIKKAGEYLPDLILMDMVLQGSMRGSEAAEIIHNAHDTPIIFLTAYADENTLNMAKASEPYGYLIKPFEERELQATIDMFFYKIDLEEKLKGSELRFSALIKKAHDGILVIQEENRIIEVNKVILSLTGYIQDDLINHPYHIILPELNTKTLQNTRVIETSLLKKNGTKADVEISHSIFRTHQQETMMLIVRDITERKRNQLILKSRDQILESLGKVAELMLTGEDVEKALNKSMKLIGKATSADRCYIFKNVYNENQVLCMSLRFGWVAKDITPQLNYALLQQLPYEGNADTVYELLSQEKVYTNKTSQFNPSERYFLDEMDIKSLLLVPINVDNVWWGFIGLDDCKEEREWAAAEIEALKTVARVMGAAIQSHQARQTLKKSEDKYRLLVDSINDGIVISQNEEFIFFNNRFAEMLGYSNEEMRNINYHKIYSRKGLKILMDRFEKRQLGEEVPDKYETFFTTKDGKEIDVEANITVIDYEGAIATFAVIRDISDRKKAEEEINMLAHAIKSISEAVSVADMNDKIIYVNNAFTKMYGYRRDELIGKDIKIVRPENSLDNKDLNQAIYQGTMNGGWQGELYNIRKNGSVFPIMLSTSIIYDDTGIPRATIGVARDITDRKQSEKEIFQSRERLNIILHSIGNGVVVIDSNNRVIISNDRSRELLSLKDPLSPLPPLTDLLIHCENHGKNLTDSLHETNISNLELIVTDPGHRILSVTGNTFDDVDGKSAGKVFILRDVTQEKEIDRMKTDFVSSVSHELRTPLTSIMGFSNTILRKDNIPEKMKKEFVEIIFNESKRLARLIEDVLSISKIETGKLTYEMKALHLNEVIEDALLIYKTQAEDKQINLTYEKESDIPEILGDRDSMSQIIVNLVSNAIKFTPTNGNIYLRLRKTPKELILEVEDNGMGIPACEQDKIFNKFYRIHRPGTQIQGTGLGLSIVKEIVEKHNGHIELISAENKGSLFRIYMPVYVSNE